MRNYLIDSDRNEIVLDLVRTIPHSSELVEYHFAIVEEGKVVGKEIVYISQLCGQYFSSLDRKSWIKLPRQNLSDRILNINKVYDLYRGFKPSSLSAAGEGALITQMPGKVVKILVAEEEEVQEGQPLLILEAMKMENEIKSGVKGSVKTIHVKEGDALDSGVVMLEVEPE